MAKKKDLMNKMAELEAQLAEAKKGTKDTDSSDDEALVARPDSQIESEPEPEPEESESVPDPDLVELIPDTELEPEAEPEPEVKPESEVKPKAEPEVKPEPAAEPEVKPEPEPEVKPEPEPETAEKLFEIAEAMEKYRAEKVAAFEEKHKEYAAEIDKIRAKAQSIKEAEAKAKAEAEAKAKAEAEAKAKAEARARAEAEAKAKAEAEAKVRNGHPGKAYNYYSSTKKKWISTQHLWKAMQFSGGQWMPVGAWYDSDGNFHHLLSEEEADRYFPNGF